AQDMTVVDRPDVRSAVDQSADPLRARASLERIVAAHPGLDAQIADDPLLRDALVAVSVASNALFAALERDRGAAEMLTGTTLLAGFDVSNAPALLRSDDPPRALRRWKRRQIVRIAGRDLLGVAPLRVVAHELAQLADASLQVALDIAAPKVPVAVIGM